MNEAEEDTYEQQRQATIKANRELLAQLGLDGLKADLRGPSPPPIVKKSHKRDPNHVPRTTPSVPAATRTLRPRRDGSSSSTAKQNDEDVDDEGNPKRRALDSPPRAVYKLKKVAYERAPEQAKRHGTERGVRVTRTDAPLPTREELKKGMGGKGALIFETGYTHFRPNLTPEEMLRGGMMGGGPFRTHASALSGRPTLRHTDVEEFPASWYSDLAPTKLYNDANEAACNRFGVTSGQSLSEWESSGWVHDDDRRGWWQWYFRFYMGRRHEDDARQISRWMKAAGPAGRFKRSLAGKIVAARSTWDDESVSPVVRQCLWHWAYELNEADFKAYLPS